MASAIDQVAAIINNAFAQSNAAINDMKPAISAAYNALAALAPIPAPTTVSLPVLPARPRRALTTFTNNEFTDPIDQIRDDFQQRMEDEASKFMADNFPVDTITDAQNWIKKAIVEGGTGVNATVEQQTWERNRNAILKDAARAEDDLTTSWVSRRFPVPPGALNYGILMLRRDAVTNIAVAANVQAVESWKTEVENVRFAVGKAIDLRDMALKAALDYIQKVTAGASAFGLQEGQAIRDALLKFEDATIRYYELDMTRFERPIRNTIENLERGIDNQKVNNAAELQRRIKMAETAMSGAQSLGTLAAAAVNALHAQAAISGTDIFNFQGN